MVYVSLGGYKDVNLSMYCQTTEAYPEGEVFVVLDEEAICVALLMGPNGSQVELENPALLAAVEKYYEEEEK